jgi:arginine/lysine/ornithine decarboxylase
VNLNNQNEVDSRHCAIPANSGASIIKVKGQSIEYEHGSELFRMLTSCSGQQFRQGYFDFE